jgi:hypothetical protein
MIVVVQMYGPGMIRAGLIMTRHAIADEAW